MVFGKLQSAVTPFLCNSNEILDSTLTGRSSIYRVTSIVKIALNYLFGLEYLLSPERGVIFFLFVVYVIDKQCQRNLTLCLISLLVSVKYRSFGLRVLKKQSTQSK